MDWTRITSVTGKPWLKRYRNFLKQLHKQGGQGGVGSCPFNASYSEILYGPNDLLISIASTFLKIIILGSFGDDLRCFIDFCCEIYRLGKSTFYEVFHNMLVSFSFEKGFENFT